MHLIVGLGNPGAKYAHSRHNVGFDVVEVLSQRHNIPLKRTKCRATIGEGFIEGQKVILAQPETFMNLSGEAVSPLMQFYKLDMDQLLVVYDDIDLPEGRLRMREKGSAGTHNGMRNIVYQLGRDDFARLRVGIGRPPEYMDLADYVLSGYSTPELRKTMFDAFCHAADAVEILLRDGFPKAQQYAANAGKEG
ncbi:MAG: aminoacyl-tRNA hydrolase [Clostridia bacterium]|nr:aminoacyl-tRNA hydrolase [Clostridia bacterium]